MKKLKLFKKEGLVLGLILILGLFLRLYQLNEPLADHHSWRQADTAAVARNFVKEGFDFFHPRIDNMTPLARPDLPNNERLFMVEPPFYNSLVALAYSFWGVQIKWARLVSVLFSLGAIIFLYGLVKTMVNRPVATLSAFFMSVLPYSVFYSRVVLPEPLMLFASLGMLYFFSLWLREEKNSLWFWALVFTSLSLTLKTFPLFLSIPMFFLVWQKWKWGFLKEKKLWLLVILGVLPLIGWRLWTARFPQGVPPYGWLFNQGGIRFRPAFFRWLFGERIGKLILGSWGVFLLVLGVVLKPFKKEGWFFHWWLVAFFVYLAVFASGNVTHDYYQIPFIPICAFFLGKGAAYLLSFKSLDKKISRVLAPLALGVVVLFALGFSWYEVKGFYLIQGGVDLAGLAVDQNTPPDALVLTGDSNDATLLYNTNRHGWTGGYASYFPNTPETIKRVKEMGASYYVTTRFEKDSEFGSHMLENYPVVKQSDQFVLFSLEESLN